MYKAGDLSVDCLGVQNRLRDWQATRRLKSAINTFVALLRMSSAMLSDFPDEMTQKQILERVRGDPARLQVPVRMSECFEMEQDEAGI